MKQKFNKWFATHLRNEFESGKELENITIKFFLSTTKPLHCRVVNRLLQSVKFVTRIFAAVEDGLIAFLIDPFNEIDPLTKPLKST